VDVRVSWEQDLAFIGLAASGFPIQMSSPAGPEVGAGPVEILVMSLAACTAMDVISILRKKQERVEDFHVSVHADRAESYPKVITRAELHYVVTGRDIHETAVRRAIELSVGKYCPVHAMLAMAFPIDLQYSILDGSRGEAGRLIKRDRYVPSHTALLMGDD
jgi:putative redox protein